MANPSPYVSEPHRVSGVLLSNSTAVRHIFDRTLGTYDLLMQRKVFLLHLRFLKSASRSRNSGNNSMFTALQLRLRHRGVCPPALPLGCRCPHQAQSMSAVFHQIRRVPHQAAQFFLRAGGLWPLDLKNPDLLVASPSAAVRGGVLQVPHVPQRGRAAPSTGPVRVRRRAGGVGVFVRRLPRLRGAPARRVTSPPWCVIRAHLKAAARGGSSFSSQASVVYCAYKLRRKKLTLLFAD